MAFLELAGLGKSFADRDRPAEPRWIIRNLTCAIEEGEFVTMIGPSGAGKSTLLNLIAQTDLPSAGEVRMRGKVVSHAGATMLDPGVGRQIGYVTQEDNLLPWRSMRDNVLFPLEVQGALDDAGRRRADALIEAVGLKGFERHYPHELSGGMRKRCALIRTLVYAPPVILMDEPFGALDAQTRAQLQADLMNLWTIGRKTILFVTHDIAEAIVLGDRTLVLSKAPTTIAAEHRIPITRPRDAHNVFGLEGFAALHEAIRAQVQ